MDSGPAIARLKLLLFAGILLAFAGCATAPTQEMSDARQALQAARDVDAGKHAPQQLDSAQVLLNQARDALSGRTFERARKDALAAKRAAIQARNVTVSIRAARNVVAEAVALGILSKQAEKKYREAVVAAKRGDGETALKLAEQTKTLIEQDIGRQADIP